MDFMLLGREFFFLSSDKQWDKLGKIFTEYIFDNVYNQVAVFLLLIMLSTIFFALASGNKKRRILKQTALFIYGIVLVILFILGRKSGSRGLRGFNYTWYFNDQGFHEGNIFITIINFVCFIPYGILLRWQRKRSHWAQMISIVCITSILIEILQFVLKRGDLAIQDIIAYIIGGIFGVIICNMFRAKY